MAARKFYINTRQNLAYTINVDEHDELSISGSTLTIARNGLVVFAAVNFDSLIAEGFEVEAVD
jgi:hypothetical protein